MSNRLLKYIVKNYPQSKRLLVRLKQFTLPGFEGVPVFNVLQFFIQELERGTLPTRAKSIAFSFFLAIFPFIIFLFTLIPYIQIENFQESITTLVQQIMPNAASYDLIKATIEDVVNRPRGGVLSLNIILALFFSTQGVLAMMDSFDKAQPIFKKRNFLLRQWIAFKITALLMLMFLISIVLIIGGRGLYFELLEMLNITSSYGGLFFETIRYIIILLLFFFSISLIFFYGPAVKDRWRFITLGSTVTTVLSIGFSLGFSYYVTNLVEYNSFYGSIGTIILVLIWIYLNSLILLIGFELNTGIYYHKSLLVPNEEQHAA
ncbi:MAG: YihY/virulence factor BrkB family protein [Chitinophagales bacterium]|nr:YihY/virulence factor BrkB family protein [Chitinophagales bacterium]